MSLGVLPSGTRAHPAAGSDEPRREGKISVCHIASGDLWAGAEVQLAALLGALVRPRDLVLRVILLNEGRLAEEVRRCGIDLRVIPESERSLWQIVSEATDYLRGQSVQILHSHRYKENLLAALLAWRCDVPFLVRSQHGLPEPFGGIRRLRQGLLQQLDRLVARYATHRVISVSKELRDHLTRTIDPRKVVVIQNGLDTERVSSALSIAEAKRKLGIREDHWVVGFAGRLEPIKRLDIFLEAAKIISQRASRVRFVIAGQGREEFRLRAQASALGLEQSVLFLGQRDDIYDVLRAMDLFVFSSDHEGLPMVLLEALYLGVPVVARAVGGISEVIGDGGAGIPVESASPSDLAEACISILEDQSRRGDLSVAGRILIAERFSVDRTAFETANLYRSLCAESSISAATRTMGKTETPEA